MMYCEHCGAPNADGNAYCIRCGAPLIQQPQGGAPSIQQPLQGYFDEENPVLATIRGMLGGSLFLTCAISYSVSLLFQLLSSLQGASQWSSLLSRFNALAYLGGGYGYDPRTELLQKLLDLSSGALTSGHIIGALLGMLPSILIAVGLWMLFASAKGQGPIRTVGLAMIRVICILAVVGISLLSLVLEVALIVAAVSISNNYGSATGILVTVILLVLLFGALGIVYQVKLVTTTGVMRNAVQRGKPYAKVSVFAAVMNYILGGVSAISALAALVSAGLIACLQAASMATALICFGILIFSYKKNIELLKQGAVPDIARTAPTAPPAPNQWSVTPPMPHQNAGGYQNVSPQLGGAGWGGTPPPPAGPSPYAQGRRPDPPETTVLDADGIPSGGVCYVVRAKTGQRYPITRARFRIGRNYDSDLCVEDNTVVGRSHAEIVFHDGSFFLVDKHSSNHSYLKGVELTPEAEYKLDSGALFVLGNEEFWFET